MVEKNSKNTMWDKEEFTRKGKGWVHLKAGRVEAMTLNDLD